MLHSGSACAGELVAVEIGRADTADLERTSTALVYEHGFPRTTWVESLPKHRGSSVFRVMQRSFCWKS